ncbi:MAG: sialidase family protein [Acidimicrobiia bacterium]
MVTNTVVFREQGRYCSHPCIAKLANGDWLVAFSAAPQGDKLRHPPDYPDFVNLLVRSSDQGRSWSKPYRVPNGDWHGVEVPAIAQISTGEVFLNQWRFRWFSTDAAKARQASSADQSFYFNEQDRRWRRVTAVSDWAAHPYPYARADDGAYVHVSDDGGQTWSSTVPIDINPYQGAFGLKGVIELTNGDLVMPMGSHDHDPLAAIFLVRSRDRGRSWDQPTEVARVAGLIFSEPSALVAASGALLVFSREETNGFIHQSVSEDGGLTWAQPRRLDLWGYPTQGIELADGRILIVYGHRRQPFGIKAAMSKDGGKTWVEEIQVRADLADTYTGHNLGYPSVIECEPGRLFVVYYGEDEGGSTCIYGTYLGV